jgi:hypothetical protein
MPTAYRIDVVPQLVRSRAWGELTTEEFRDHYSRLIVDPRFQPSFRGLTCLDDVTKFTIEPWMIAEVSSWPVFNVGTRRAVVARADVGYGLARMFSLHAERVGQNVRAFRDVREAQEWLDSPLVPGREPGIAPPAIRHAQLGAA